MEKETFLGSCRLIAAGVRTAYVITGKLEEYNQFVTAYKKVIIDIRWPADDERGKGLHSYEHRLYHAFCLARLRVASNYLKFQLLTAAFVEILNSHEQAMLIKAADAYIPQPGESIIKKSEWVPLADVEKMFQLWDKVPHYDFDQNDTQNAIQLNELFSKYLNN